MERWDSYFKKNITGCINMKANRQKGWLLNTSIPKEKFLRGRHSLTEIITRGIINFELRI
jgi:hypothetical protein